VTGAHGSPLSPLPPNLRSTNRSKERLAFDRSAKGKSRHTPEAGADTAPRQLWDPTGRARWARLQDRIRGSHRASDDFKLMEAIRGLSPSLNEVPSTAGYC